MSLNVEGNNAVLTTDIEVKNRSDKKEKINNKKIIYEVIKRIVDIIGALVGIVFLIPITISLYIFNKIIV